MGTFPLRLLNTLIIVTTRRINKIHRRPEWEWISPEYISMFLSTRRIYINPWEWKRRSEKRKTKNEKWKVKRGGSRSEAKIPPKRGGKEAEGQRAGMSLHGDCSCNTIDQLIISACDPPLPPKGHIRIQVNQEV